MYLTTYFDVYNRETDKYERFNFFENALLYYNELETWSKTLYLIGEDEYESTALSEILLETEE